MEGPSTSQGGKGQFEFIQSERGQVILLRHGYKHNQHRKNKNGITVWRCVNRKQCKAFLTTNSQHEIVKEDHHLCKPNHIDNEVKRHIDTCIKRAQNETTSMPQIYSDAVIKLKDAGYDLVQNIPDYKNLKRRLYLHRNKALKVSKIVVRKAKDMTIPPCFEELVFADYKCKQTRLILFANKEVLPFLNNAETVFCDGTFKSCVPPFLQLYTLHIDVGSTSTHTNILPAIYALLPNKKEKTYELFFRLIKSRIPQFAPTVITMDFEKSAMLAIQTVFGPHTRIQGCLFHFKRCIYRKLKQLGMNKFLIYKIHALRCIALAYLPQEYRSDGWLYIEAENENEPKLTQFNNYFVNTWLKESAYYSDKWTFFDVIHKTNNAIEAWNARFNKMVKPKPNIVMLLKVLQKDSQHYLTMFHRNHYISVKSCERIRLQKRIEDIVNQFLHGHIDLQLCIEKLSH